ncbi:MAG: sigma-54-dependent Fis family transcriptional regulator [Acidobacteria bacterium]|nr:sigma-54-dependent Fis family transcriptional regulator [Acidobacteriota bacterium]
MTQHAILVVDDDEGARELLSEALLRDGYAVTGAGSAEEAMEVLGGGAFDLVITDVHMDGQTGIDLTRFISEHHPGTLVVVVTAFGSSDVTIQAVRAGAFDFIPKPFQLEKIRRIVSNALAKRDRIVADSLVEPAASVRSSTGRLIGTSEKMIDVFKLIGRVANTETTVLIEGESGTGKELVARAIHENSFRRDKPFIAINCGAITETLLESELFGYERGAFTGADKAHAGIFEAVNGGTCLLDEIGEMPLPMQAKLLRVLQDGEVRRVGSTREIHVDVRILAATHRDLEAMMRENRFREDLYYRLNVVRLTLPPLRERPADIPLLAGFFLRQYQERNRRKGLLFSEEVLRAFLSYAWPGNVRELAHVVESAATLTPTPVITLESLPSRVSTGVRDERLLEPLLPRAGHGGLLPLDEVERIYILHVLKEVEGNKSMAARVLGLDRKTLRLKLKQYGYDAEDAE